jgi:uncharacterized protein (TIGR03546 family)
MIWLIRNILLALSSETSPWQIAFGAVFGIALGLCPIDNLIWPILLLMVFFLRINFGMCIVFFTVGKLIGVSTGELKENLGQSVLTSESTQSVFSYLYNTPVLGISGFNQPSVLGSLALTLLFSVILIPVMIYFTKIFRSKIQPRLEKIWIIKVLKGSKLYQLYTKIVG